VGDSSRKSPEMIISFNKYNAASLLRDDDFTHTHMCVYCLLEHIVHG